MFDITQSWAGRQREEEHQCGLLRIFLIHIFFPSSEPISAWFPSHQIWHFEPLLLQVSASTSLLWGDGVNA